jgi:hypothetical protein
MTETPQPEPDWGNVLVDIGKKYIRLVSLTLDSATRQIQQTPRAKKRVAKPSPQNLGILGWLKGPEVEERKD